jgi:patatin-like phospholipase/acyl hydrolase
MKERVFRILSIDGGGIRGVFPAHILDCISCRLGINILDHIDMIAGTSTGSIIAASIACKIKPSIIVSLYRKYGPVIFTPIKSFWPKKCKPVFHSIYDSKRLREILKDTFGDIKLGDVMIPLLLPATDVGLGGVHVFKSNYSKDFTRDNSVLLYEAVLASCSAPLYFNPTLVKEYLLADGGLWANNPSLASVIDAQRRLKIRLEDIRILSLGTGHSITSYGVKANRPWGIISGWRGKEFAVDGKKRSIVTH